MKNYYYLLGVLGLLLLPSQFLAQYCSPAFTSGCQYGDFIAGVSLGAINNQSSGCSPGYYADNTSTMSASVNQALNYTVQVTLNPSYNQGIGVFIDWNQNQSFGDPGEFYSTGAQTTAGQTEAISISVPLTATLGTTRMRVICRYAATVTSTGACGGWSYGEAEDYAIVVNPAPSCLPTDAVMANNVLAYSADISWNSVAGAVDYNVEWGVPGFTPGTGASVGSQNAVSGTSLPISGLSAQTDYQVYVQTNCGSSTSPWGGPVSFTTQCAYYSAPWVENLTTTTTPNCWSQSATTGGPWQFPGSPGYTAFGTLDHTSGASGNYATLDHSSNDAGVILESPIIDVSALNVPELRFWIWSHYDGSGLSTYNPTYIEAYDGVSWQQLGVVQGDFGPQWTEFNFVIPPTMIYSTDLVRVRFRGESGGDVNDYYNDILLDDISITEAPTCPAPINLTVVDADTNSAILTWTTVGSETEWELEWGPVGFIPGSGAGSHLTGNNPDTIIGLTSNSFYEVYLRAVCTPGDTSFLVGPSNFHTYDQGIYMEADATCGPGFIDISESGIDLQLTDDSEAGFTLPFPWLFQGTQVNQITVGNNGGIVVNSTSANISYTMTAGDGFYPFIQDLDNDIAGVNQVGVLWEVVGTAPNRKFIVLWKNRTHYPGTTYQNPVTFEFIYEEGTNEAYYIYEDVDFGYTNFNNGGDAEIGVQGPTNDVVVSMNNASYLSDNSCVHLYYTDCPKPTNLQLQYVTPDEAAFSWSSGLANDTAWTIIYGPAGFDPTTGGTVLTAQNNPTIQLVGLDQLTEYDIYVYANCSATLQSYALVGNFKTLPLCSDPNSVSNSTAVDSLFSNWNWTAFDPMYPVTNFDIYYGNPGFNPATGGNVYNGDAVVGDTVDNPNFLAGGVYEMYVQAVCDTLVSNFVGPLVFTMPLTNDDVCGAETFPIDNVAYSFNNQGASTEANESSIAPPVTGAQTTTGWLNNTMTYTTWFKFIAPSTGQVRFSGVEQGFNGQMAVYEAITCNDFTSFNLIAANDDEIDGTSLAPNFTICGLTPGAEYYLVHDSYSTSQTGIYSIRGYEIDLIAGTSNPMTNICSQDTINLFNGISGNQSGGEWLDTDNTFHIVDDSLFNTAGLAYQVYNFEYRLTDGCAFDSIVTQFEVYPASSAGNDGSVTICKNEPTGLLAALTGSVMTGGQWYDPMNAPHNTSYIVTGELDVPGTYNFVYIVGNNVCPDDTSIVSVSVRSDCDFIGLEEGNLADLTVYPNPTTAKVTITASIEENVNIEILDMNGRLIATLGEQSLVGGYKVDLERFEPGVYLIKLSNAQGQSVLRVSKK